MPVDRNENTRMNWNTVLNLVFPPRCLPCNKALHENGVICASCFAEIPRAHTLFCGKCHARLPYPRKICHKDFPYMLAAATHYAHPGARELIHGLKFNRLRQAALPLSTLLAEYIERIPLDFKTYTVVPIPLGKERLRERGFNQAKLIGEIFARRFEIPIDNEALARARDTAPQSELGDPEARKKNMRGAFCVREPERLNGKNILLIDDVTTSGATFYEAASALRHAGAKRIIGLAVARS